MKKRIYSIDLFKLVFAYFIALGHFGANPPLGSGVTVQLFFIVSGFFLAKKFYSKSYLAPQEYNQWDYTKEHIKSLYPHYIFSLIVLAVYTIGLGVNTFIKNPTTLQLRGIGQIMYELVPEFLLLQNSGFLGGGLNYPLWQMSVLLICGYFIYGLLCLNEKVSRMIILPAAIIMIQAFLTGDIDGWGSVGFFPVPLLRAFSPMCIGVLAYYITTTPYYDFLKKHKIVFNLSAILFFIFLFVYQGHRNIFLITFVVILLALYDGESWLNKLFNHKIFKSFGEFSYAIYLNHAFVVYVLNNHVFNRIKMVMEVDLSQTYKNLIFLLVLTVYSVFTVILIKKFQKYRIQKKKTQEA